MKTNFHTTHGAHRLAFVLLALLLSISWMQAQVTIGSGTAPQNFSTLEIVSNDTGGLRLPHLSTKKRDDLTKTQAFADEKGRSDASNAPGLALGLTIYNIDTNCTEYWNGHKWVSLCLGTADIKLASSCGGFYDPANPPVEAADGSLSGCDYTPEEDPVCTVTIGRPFEVQVVIGAAYAKISITDQATSKFIVQFQPNNTNASRNVVVRVTSNCTGEHKDFLFTQAAGVCPAAADPVVNASSTDLCVGGSVVAYITNAQPNVNYIWTYLGAVVHTGNLYTINRAGTYKVYAGLIGCGTPATVTITDSGTAAPAAVQIAATNGGVICGNANVVITANVNGPVQWYHDGVLHSSTANSLTVSGAASAGQWFAVVKDGSCTSLPSNVVTLIDNTTAGTALPAPVATVNGYPLDGISLNICKSGTLRLEVTNPTDYPAGVEYEWFIGGATISKGSSPVYMYNVPDHIGNIVLSVIVSDKSGNCPNSATSTDTQVTLTAPAATSINNGELIAPICTGSSVQLMADINTGVAYEWYKDGIITLDTGPTMTATPGEYTVRYTDDNVCWSRMSTKITVVQSGELTLTWNTAPTGKAIKGSSVIYTLNSNIKAPAYEWTHTYQGPENPIASISPVGDGSTAVVVYSNPTADDINMTLTVTTKDHPCGNKSLTQDIVVEDGCVRGTVINIVPKGTVEIKEGQEVNFAVSTDASDVDRQFFWFIDDVQVATTTTIEWKHKFPTMGTYKVTAQVINKCTPLADNVITAIATIVKVAPDLSGYLPEPSGDYYILGKDCYDVGITNMNDYCGDRTTRGNGDFMDNDTPPKWNAEGKEWEYEFKYGFYDDGNLFFTVTDNAKIIKSSRTDIGMTYVKFYIVFDESVMTKARGLSRDDALKITITAAYTVTGQKRQVSRVIKVQDCECGCGLIGTSSGKWRRIACHNLGANTAADPFDNNSPMAKEGLLNGSYYQWGKKKEVAKYDTSAGAISGWSNSYANDNSWNGTNKTANDPCPDGFRVPSLVEMNDFLSFNNTITKLGTWTDAATNYTSGNMWGTATGQYLYLPAAGLRQSGNGTLYGRGINGYYWTTNTFSGAYANHLTVSEGGLTTSYQFNPDKIFGFSVRCVSEK